MIAINKIKTDKITVLIGHLLVGNTGFEPVTSTM